MIIEFVTVDFIILQKLSKRISVPASIDILQLQMAQEQERRLSRDEMYVKKDWDAKSVISQDIDTLNGGPIRSSATPTISTSATAPISPQSIFNQQSRHAHLFQQKLTSTDMDSPSSIRIASTQIEHQRLPNALISPPSIRVPHLFNETPAIPPTPSELDSTQGHILTQNLQNIFRLKQSRQTHQSNKKNVSGNNINNSNTVSLLPRSNSLYNGPSISFCASPPAPPSSAQSSCAGTVRRDAIFSSVCLTSQPSPACKTNLDYFNDPHPTGSQARQTLFTNSSAFAPSPSLHIDSTFITRKPFFIQNETPVCSRSNFSITHPIPTSVDNNKKVRHHHSTTKYALESPPSIMERLDAKSPLSNLSNPAIISHNEKVHAHVEDRETSIYNQVHRSTILSSPPPLFQREDRKQDTRHINSLNEAISPPALIVAKSRVLKKVTFAEFATAINSEPYEFESLTNSASSDFSPPAKKRLRTIPADIPESDLDSTNYFQDSLDEVTEQRGISADDQFCLWLDDERDEKETETTASESPKKIVKKESKSNCSHYIHNEPTSQGEEQYQPGISSNENISPCTPKNQMISTFQPSPNILHSHLPPSRRLPPVSRLSRPLIPSVSRSAPVSCPPSDLSSSPMQHSSPSIYHLPANNSTQDSLHTAGKITCPTNNNLIKVLPPSPSRNPNNVLLSIDHHQSRSNVHVVDVTDSADNTQNCTTIACIDTFTQDNGATRMFSSRSLSHSLFSSQQKTFKSHNSQNKKVMTAKESTNDKIQINQHKCTVLMAIQDKVIETNEVKTTDSICDFWSDEE